MYAERYVIIIFCRNSFDHFYLGLDYRLIQSGMILESVPISSCFMISNCVTLLFSLLRITFIVFSFPINHHLMDQSI